MKKIQMVDLKGQYNDIKDVVNPAIQEVIENTSFINGPKVHEFQKHLEEYLKVKHVIPCANGTDALQVAMMALGLKPGDEVITTTFTFVALFKPRFLNVIVNITLSPTLGVGLSTIFSKVKLANSSTSIVTNALSQFVGFNTSQISYCIVYDPPVVPAGTLIFPLASIKVSVHCPSQIEPFAPQSIRS